MAGIRKITSINTYSRNTVSAIRPQSERASSEYAYEESSKENQITDHTPEEESSESPPYSADDFYANVHRFKSAYETIQSHESDPASYYRKHRSEIEDAAEALSTGINRLLSMADTCDSKKNTHFFFLIESVLFAFEPDLMKLGLSYHKRAVSVDAFTLYVLLSETPFVVSFLFENNGFIELLLRIHERLNAYLNADHPEGSIIDFKA
ncbi:MAG: hypothetical protein PWQ12_489 [Clostridiales bacterium]|jgi:hypothetical protein|nr:hypothetical protein [Clostridiales bacterium]